ncbi:MAG: type VI secretion system baseplate subunit TssF [Puniceicoccales bacterium]|jgi:type VI secretion system protein ImpG|nr:type VI secretion system baseplate subunit TssF [Puniceicoccales bacterium]
MNHQFLTYYNDELRHLRKSTAEFAREYPKIAGRLVLDESGTDVCPDPYVERLLEGVAYLAARVHMKLDAEFPRFTQSLIETVYPHLLAPVPSMAIVKFDVPEKDAALAKGPVVPAGSMLRSILGRDDRTPCTFRTAHNVRLLPVRIDEVHYFTRDVQALNLPRQLNAKAALRVRLRTTGGLTFDKIALDPLTLFFAGAGNLPGALYEHIFAHQLGVVVQTTAHQRKTLVCAPPEALRRVGFAENEALLPADARVFSGYRLLREYFAFPQRFLFCELSGFADALAGCNTESVLDFVIPLEKQEPRLEGIIDRTCFDLHCTPVINLFPKTLDHILLNEQLSEFHVVPDRNRPLDFEVFQLTSVTGASGNVGEHQPFHPFYTAKDTDMTSGAYYTTQRVQRMLTAREKQFGKKSDYTGTEVYLSLVDVNAAPYRPELKQLSLTALCTNRHLPIQMAIGVTGADFTMESNMPVTGIRCVVAPTEPRPSFAEGRFSWRLINHLSLNYRSLFGSGDGADTSGSLREILRLYINEDHVLQRQVEGLTKVQTRPVIRRSSTPGPVSFVRGAEVTLEFDEDAYEGTGAFLLASVLACFVSKYASINSFTETVVATRQRGKICRLRPHAGKRSAL